jgi:hypothetical protein
MISNVLDREGGVNESSDIGRRADDADIRREPLKAEAGDRKMRVPPPFFLSA